MYGLCMYQSENRFSRELINDGGIVSLWSGRYHGREQFTKVHGEHNDFRQFCGCVQYERLPMQLTRFVDGGSHLESNEPRQDAVLKAEKDPWKCLICMEVNGPLTEFCTKCTQKRKLAVRVEGQPAARSRVAHVRHPPAQYVHINR